MHWTFVLYFLLAIMQFSYIHLAITAGSSAEGAAAPPGVEPKKNGGAGGAVLKNK